MKHEPTFDVGAQNAEAQGLSDVFCRRLCDVDASTLPEKTRRAAALAILDATGTIAAAAALSPETQAFLKLARSDAGSCSLFGGGEASPAMAAFANGALAHALDYEDVFERAPCHPNAAAIPAAIAMAQAVGGVTGAEFLAAVALGCEAACRLALSVQQPLEVNGWYPPPIFGAFGATVAAGRIARLTPEQLRDALSLTLCQTTAPGEIKHSAGSHVRAVREAFGARAAVTSVLLAADGVRGFERPLEGDAGFFQLYADGRYDADMLTDGVGEHFLIEEISFKPWPSCRGTHAYIELAMNLKLAHRFHWRDIVRIDAPVGAVQEMLIAPLYAKRAPSTFIGAKFSIPFTLGLAFTRDRVSLLDFDEISLADEAVLAIAALVHPEKRADWGRNNASSGALRVTLRNGAVFEAETHTPKGHHANPMSEDELVAKFIECASCASPLNAEAAATLAREIIDIESSADAGALFASVFRGLNGHKSQKHIEGMKI
ncbi:MmgE/PrpD family protein [Hyphococcus sp.]|jgi:2-methylcitrate dehydratase PrpD|uniref:MmgE/PrpD family protein n=1 Tax=Hyphococcus sp. TaxID=2038636 RepID=UPI003D0F2E59